MTSIIADNYYKCLLRSRNLLFAIALILTALILPIEPALANEQRELIATRMMELQDSQERWIQINLTEQLLIAWEGSEQVYLVKVSTGKESTPTLTGTFAIESKRPLDRMRGEDYDVPDVPYAMYYDRGYAIHGAYWHRKFGTPVSHGCINVAVDHAEWLFDWASEGTSVVIHE
ncbi:MAG: L,D-transpeptidase [Symploca sp. SIO2E9]|nr:L,D-transpeptidase [Symploca sp. SIO2E9]